MDYLPEGDLIKIRENQQQFKARLTYLQIILNSTQFHAAFFLNFDFS